MKIAPPRERYGWKVRVDCTPTGVRRDTCTMQKMEGPVVGYIYRQYSLIILSFAAAADL